MKRKMSFLLAFALTVSTLLACTVFGATDDPVQFVVNSANYINGQTTLEIKGQYVNVGNRIVSDVTETHLEIYSDTTLVAQGTLQKEVTESIYMAVGAASREYTLQLQNPVTGLKLTNIACTSKVMYNPGNLAQLPTGKKVFYNGIQVVYDVPPAIVSGRLLVPARATFEKMGAQVEWNAEAKSVTVQRDSDRVVLFIGSTTMTVNGSPFKLDAPAQIIEGRTLVPLRAISSALGDKILYGPTSEVVAIYSVK